MKKLRFLSLGLLLVTALFLAGCKTENTPSGEQAAPAAGTQSSPATRAPEVGSNQDVSKASVCTPKLTGEESLDGFSLKWTHCLGEDFQFYKLIRSTLDSTPTYAENDVVYTENNPANASYFDRDFGQFGTKYYYRVCAIRPVNEAHCSNTVSFTQPK